MFRSCHKLPASPCLMSSPPHVSWFSHQILLPPSAVPRYSQASLCSSCHLFPASFLQLYLKNHHLRYSAKGPSLVTPRRHRGPHPVPSQRGFPHHASLTLGIVFPSPALPATVKFPCWVTMSLMGPDKGPGGNLKTTCLVLHNAIF